MQQIVVGERAPDFELTDQAGSEWSLGGNRGRIVLLLFYPGNETLVCTKQLCSLRDNWAKYAETTAEIVGVSVSLNEENGNFASKYRLALTILSDPDREVPRAYANHWLFPLNFMRGLTVVDAEGIVRNHQTMLRAFRPNDHDVLLRLHAARFDRIEAEHHKLRERVRIVLLR